MKNKKANTALFIVLATVLNIIIMVALFILSFVLIAKFVPQDSSMLPLWIGLAFVLSIGGSFLLYSAVVKWISKKTNIDSYLAPLWTPKKPRQKKGD